jgi:hypothetical protein
LRIHAYADRIISNRLHSAIVGSVLGRPVDLLPGNYHKNRSIWEFCLSQRGVRWLDDFAPENVARPLGYWMPHRIRNSWKVSRTLMRIQGVPLK